MRIVFGLRCNDKEETDLQRSFCEFIVNSIKGDILNVSNIQKVEVVSSKILSLKWIAWKNKPVKIDPYRLMSLIANSIRYKHIKNNVYMIEIDPSICYPGSYTKLERFVRFLDKGNMVIKGSHIFTGIFAKYYGNINKLWRMFISNKLKRYEIDNYFIIK